MSHSTIEDPSSKSDKRANSQLERRFGILVGVAFAILSIGCLGYAAYFGRGVYGFIDWAIFWTTAVTLAFIAGLVYARVRQLKDEIGGTEEERKPPLVHARGEKMLAHPAWRFVEGVIIVGGSVYGITVIDHLVVDAWLSVVAVASTGFFIAGFQGLRRQRAR